MRVDFLTPLGGLVALSALRPLGVFVARERRARRVRRTLGLDEPGPVASGGTALALTAVPALLALAAAQPVLDLTRTRPERTDAEVLVVLDTSRSMLAASSRGSETRYERARETARRIALSLDEVPFGLASITDRTLPHVLPTTDARVYLSALERSIGVERPPPAFFYTTHATTLGSLRVVPTRGFFSPTARKRLLIVLTDGETREAGPRFARAFRRARRPVETYFVRFWREDERIYETGIAEVGYKPDARIAAGVERAAATIGGRVFEEDAVDEVLAAAKSYLGEGPTRDRERRGEKVPLMPYVTAFALVPLAVILRRRNL